MCTGVELMFAATAISGGSSVLGGLGAQQQGNEQNELNKIDAAAAIEDAKANAKIIRRQRDTVKSAATAATAASGIDVNSKTAQLIQQDIVARSTQDIYQTMVGGIQRASRLRTQGRQAKEAGDSAMAAGVLDAGGTALSGYGKIKGWQ
jgi:hypothetical protein